MSVLDLWLPILLSAVFVFIASSIVHMVLPIHKSDYRKLPGEEKILAAMRDQGVAPGGYMFPCPASMKDMSTPEMIEKFKRGPVGALTVRPSGAPSIGPSLVQWFLYALVIGAFAGYVGTIALAPGAGYSAVFRLTGTVAILGYALGAVPDSIWKGVSWWITFKFMIDGLVYGLLTAGTFGWLWPR